MCQLTLLHGQAPFVKAILGNLTLINSTGNKDGHGIFFPAPIKRVYKTVTPGSEKIFESKYWNMLENCIEDREEIALISHVRSASQTQKSINIKNTHPFKVGSIILMHNGTLEPEDEKLEIEDRIDSYWFTKRLAEVAGRKYLKPEHIAKSMEDFSGKFAFLIADLRQPDLIYVVRGRNADLGYANFIDRDGKSICFAVNTMKKNLETVSLPMFWRAIMGEEISIDDEGVTDIDKESIYVYDIPNGSLVKTDQKISERALTRVYHVMDRGSVSGGRGFAQSAYSSGAHYRAASPDENLVFELCKEANDMKLTFSELNYIFLLMFGSSIIYVNSSEIEIIREFLSKLRKTFDSNGKGKKKNMWIKLTDKWIETNPDIPILKIYEIDPQFRFPWFLNSIQGLKNVRARVKKWNSDRA